MKNKNLYYIAQFLGLAFFIGSVAFAEEEFSPPLESNPKTQSQQNILIGYNQRLQELRNSLKETYAQVKQLEGQNKLDSHCSQILSAVNEIRRDIQKLQEEWKQVVSQKYSSEEEPYGLWDQEETTLSELVMEYGSTEYLYVIPPQIAAMKMHLHSLLPIPQATWSELLEVILLQNGIGIKNINPLVRQLYFFKQDILAVDSICDRKESIALLPPQSRVAFVLSPCVEQMKVIGYFFEKFRDPKLTFIHQVGTKIVLISTKSELLKLLSLYESVWEKEREKTTRVLPLKKISSVDMEKILKAFFCDDPSQNRLAHLKGAESLQIFGVKEENIIVLVGSKPLVEKGEEVITATEEQIQDPKEMTVFWYICKHSTPTELSEALEKVYNSLLHISFDCDDNKEQRKENIETKSCNYETQTSSLPVNTPPITPGTISSHVKKSNTTNFIPYPTSGAILMVIRKDTLPKIKELLRKMDIPKRMVEIELLLFEKKIHQQDSFGLNVLRLGSAAEYHNNMGSTFNDLEAAGRGIFQFFIQRTPSKKLPAFDIFYNFLMSQEGMQVNASPSVTTINQVPATISVVEEMSINNGAAPLDTNSGITFEKSFSRAQFGITIVITPTIHEPDTIDDEMQHFVTLDTDVMFDTPHHGENMDRPRVNRRKIKNTVRVSNGETIILGGLRRKCMDDRTEKIPFLGAIPGFGKLFGFTQLRDELTEMFIFITPKIIFDPKENMIRIREAQLRSRAGDLPEFLARIEQGKSYQRKGMFERSWKLLFGSADACNN